MTTARPNDERFEREALCWLPDVTRFALSLTRNEPDAEDLVQDTFLTAYEKWHQYIRGSECRPWLFTICRHRFYRTRERNDRQVASEDAELEALAAADVHASARESGLDHAFEQSDVLNAIEGAIAELPPVYRDVALLVDVHDESYDSASVALGVPIGTVRSRLFRARRLLQVTLLAHARDAGLAVGARATGQGDTTP